MRKKEREERKRREKEKEKREKERKIVKKKELEKEIEGNGEKKDVKDQLLSICIQFSKRKTKYIGRNAQNFKKWLRFGSIYIHIIDHRHYKSSCRS